MYLGIDLGTSGVKVLLVDPEQHIIASETAPLTVSNPASGWSEQDPADWIAATKAAIAVIRQNHAKQLSAVRCIGLSGQMHGATLLDANDTVLRPCILWNDTRSHAQAAALDGQEMFQRVTGNIVFPGFTAPKINWVFDNEPEIFKRLSKVLLPKDYLRLWLTGEYISEMSDASGTSWLNVEKRCWSDDLLAASNLSTDAMPTLVEGSQKAGKLRADLAIELGLSSEVTVAGGAGDNAASAIATGTVDAGSAFVSLGTSGVVFAANDAYLPNPESAVHTFCHALPDRWHQMGVILSATAALNWYAAICNASPRDLTDELGGVLQAPTGALFLPYLAGERTPHNDADIRASWHGLGGEMSRKEMTQSVLEGVAFALRDNLEALKIAGTNVSEVTALGGGSNSRYWLCAIATALNVPVHIPDDGEMGAAFGAVRLAMLADGLGSEQELCKPSPIVATIEPDKEKLGAFEETYQRFRGLYQTGR
ncbi:MAG: xylulokinase [Hyphomicrobiales bacterium]